MVRFLAFLTLVLFGAHSNLHAQQDGVAHLNMGLIIEALPQSARADSLLRLYQDSITTGYQALEQEYLGKLENLQKNAGDLTPNQRKAIEEELGQIEQQVQVYQQESARMFELRRSQYLQPIIDSVDKAIRAYAREKDLSFIIDISKPGTVLFADAGRDITDDIIQRLR